MTWLWTLLIVVGIAMMVVAVWPSIQGRSATRIRNEKPGDDQNPEGV